MWSWAKACSLLSSSNTAVGLQSRGHCNWQIGSVCRIRRPTNNCHQIASECTKSHIFPKVFQEWYHRTPIGWGLCPQTPVPDWESEKVATLLCIYVLGWSENEQHVFSQESVSRIRKDEVPWVISQVDRHLVLHQLPQYQTTALI